MTNDESMQVEEILSAWYEWQLGYFPSLGAGRVDPSCRGFAENDRHSDIEERTDAAERRSKKRQAEQVQLCVDALTWQQRAAIQSHFGNTALKLDVWSASHLSVEETHDAYQQAKEATLPLLSRRGMIRNTETA